MKISKFSPIALFVYNRPLHVQRTVQALRNNTLASLSDLIIFSDASVDEKSSYDVDQVRKLLAKIEGFKSVQIIERSSNLGLAENIISGVSEIIEKYGKIIVLEDDLITSPCFLNYMNDALNFYHDKEAVWHISGWNYPLPFLHDHNSYLWRGMNCWGWGTWENRWKYYKKDVSGTIRSFSKADIHKLNLDGTTHSWDQVLWNESGKINSWAIFWQTTIFQNGGLCLNPAKSFIENIGLDGSGRHCNKRRKRKVCLNRSEDILFPAHIKENRSFVNRIKMYYLIEAMKGRLLKLMPWKSV